MKKLPKDTYNELAVFKKIMAKKINAMYYLEWLHEDRRIIAGCPDGLMKDIILPVNEEKYNRFLNFKINLWGDRLAFSYHPDTQIFFIKDGEPIGKAKFPVLVITVFLKDLVRFLYALDSEEIISEGKILRAVIVDAGNGDPSIMRKYPGIPEDGYDEFCVWKRRA